MKENQNHIHQLRQNLRKSSRRQFLQEKFSQKRKQNLKQSQMVNEQIFNKIMNLFDQQNANYMQLFQQYKEKLVFFSYSQQYCFRLLNLTFIIYEIFLVNPTDQCVLQILKNICFYEEIQIPQTEQFSQTIKNLFFMKYFQVGELLFYLTKNCKYGLLCARLIDQGIIDIIGQILYNAQQKYSQINKKQLIFTVLSQKQSLNYLIFELLSILSSLFTVQPILNLQQLSKIANILNFDHQPSLNQYYTFFIGNMLQKIAKEFQPQSQVAQLIFDKFQKVIFQIYKYQEEQQVCLDIIEYFWKSQVFLSSNILCLTFQGFNSNSKQNKHKLVKLLQKIVDIKKDQMEVESNQIIDLSKIPSFLQFNSMFQSKTTKKISKIDLLNQKTVCKQLLDKKYFSQLVKMGHVSQNQILKLLVLNLLLSLIQLLLSNSQLQDEPYEVLHQIFTSEQMLTLLQDSITSDHIKQIELGLNIINQISSFLKNQQFQQGLQKFKCLLQNIGVIKVVQTLMYEQKNKDIRFESENIINTFYH